MRPIDPMHAANQRRWEAAVPTWSAQADSRGLWRRCAQEPALVLGATELQYLGNLAGKRVCVLGSGDNQVVFALAGLGAQVTSVDVTEGQLRVAAERAHELHLSVAFVQADVTDLSPLMDGSFDVVYTGGHVAVWVADLPTYYREAARILVPEGLFLVSEYHPFRRIWAQSETALTVATPYDARGPFAHEYGADVLSRAPGTLLSYEFHWTVADYINAVLQAGCRLVNVDEFGADVGAWEGAPLQGLPEFLLIVARKNPT